MKKHNVTLVKILEDFTGKTFEELNEERLNKYSPDSSYLCFFERAREKNPFLNFDFFLKICYN